MTVLRSYVGGAWTEPADDGRPVLDAVTGEEVARVSSAGIDLAAALDYGRSSGGPALRELTFHQRAALLKSLGQLLREHRQELYALSARTGATLGDSKFDVDGGIGVLLSYASRAKRELPNDTILTEGAVEPLGKGGTFVGQHILTPLHGVAVQINAFNFPVWGPLEKFAPAFIAGVPSLVKPATQTAYLTARLVELMVGLRDCCPTARSSWSAAASAACSTTSASRTWWRSPGRPPPPSSCAPTRPSWAGRSGSTPKRTR